MCLLSAKFESKMLILHMVKIIWRRVQVALQLEVQRTTAKAEPNGTQTSTERKSDVRTNPLSKLVAEGRRSRGAVSLRSDCINAAMRMGCSSYAVHAGTIWLFTDAVETLALSLQMWAHPPSARGATACREDGSCDVYQPCPVHRAARGVSHPVQHGHGVILARTWPSTLPRLVLDHSQVLRVVARMISISPSLEDASLASPTVQAVRNVLEVEHSHAIITLENTSPWE